MCKMTNAETIKNNMSYDKYYSLIMDNLLRDIQEKINEQSHKGYYSISLGCDPKYDIEFNLFTGIFGSAQDKFKTEISGILTKSGYTVDLRYDKNSNKYWVISW